jgi:hypothetical protein
MTRAIEQLKYLSVGPYSVAVPRPGESNKSRECIAKDFRSHNPLKIGQAKTRCASSVCYAYFTTCHDLSSSRSKPPSKVETRLAAR